MVQRLPTLKARDVIRALKRIGFFEVCQIIREINVSLEEFSKFL